MVGEFPASGVSELSGLESLRPRRLMKNIPTIAHQRPVTRPHVLIYCRTSGEVCDACNPTVLTRPSRRQIFRRLVRISKPVLTDSTIGDKVYSVLSALGTRRTNYTIMEQPKNLTGLRQGSHGRPMSSAIRLPLPFLDHLL